MYFAIAGNATPIDSLTAKTVGANFYAQNYRINPPSLSLVHVERSPNGEEDYYVYNVNETKGFVIVSADDATEPILGYSSEGCYSSTHLSPEFVYWMQRYKRQIDYIRLHNTKASTDIVDKWNSYKNNLSPKSGKRKISTVSPLVNTLWAQSPYYNADCPGGCVAGCMATAMGQIMKYWSYPPHGIGANSYTDNPFGVLTADFDTTHYDWADMPLSVDRNNSPVALLMYDLGVGVDMEYTKNSSGSFMISADDTASAQRAFVQYFGYYGPSIQGLHRSDYDYGSWISMLENELNNGRPFFYAGFGNQGAHAWVCDGYEAGAYFHMNWGWSGYEDGYYNLDYLQPDGIPLDSNEEALIGIEPAAAIASFSADPLVVWAGDTVKFKDNSFGPVPIISWQWSLPGTSTPYSTNQNPIVVYTTPGTYNVSETVASSKGYTTLTKNSYITVLVNNTVNVYPTLNNGAFTIQLHDASLASSNLVFSLYDVLGQKILTTTLTQYITQLTVFVPHGMYFYRAYDSSGKPVSHGKLVMK